MQIHQVIKTDVSEASDLTDACRAADKKLEQLAKCVLEQQRAIQQCKVLVSPLPSPAEYILPCHALQRLQSSCDIQLVMYKHST